MKKIRTNLIAKKLVAVALTLLIGTLSAPTWALITIEITKGQDTGIPIAVVPFHFQGQQRPNEEISKIVSANLYRSGRFKLSPSDQFLSHPSETKQVRYKDWRLIKVEALAFGRVNQIGDDLFEVTFHLHDVYKGRPVWKGSDNKEIFYRWTVTGDKLRKVAHQISDYIYKALTGTPGAFDTQIAYITVRQGSVTPQFELIVADSDGHNDQIVLQTASPILSPAWAPDGKRLAYVGFGDDNTGATIWLQNLETVKRQKLLEEKVSVSSPAWSPDGRRLAVTLYRDGNPDIYIIDISSRRLRRLTKHRGIDTEASWSPDGRHLVFTSNRSGRPQIYRISTAGGPVERLTKEGRENLKASYSPNGKQLVMVTNRGNGYQIGVFYMGNRKLEILTNGTLDESPTFSPNGAMIMYATRKGGKGVLVAVSADGRRTKKIFRAQQGEVREPAWSSWKQ